MAIALGIELKNENLSLLIGSDGVSFTVYTDPNPTINAWAKRAYFIAFDDNCASIRETTTLVSYAH